MGLFGKKEQVVEEPVVEDVTELIEVKPVLESKTVIGEGITIVGDFDATEDIEIRGTVQGNIKSSHDLYVSETGTLNGNAEVENLYNDGHVDGEFTVRGLTKLSDSATLTGTLCTAKFTTTEGANFDGKLTMKK